jgi:ketosteroid isomerase-like protein
MGTGNEELVRSSFDAFLRGDWDALSRVMDPEVEWLWYEPGDWDCHDRKKVLATLFERQREGVVTALNAVVAVDERVFVEVTGPTLAQRGLPDGQACMVVTVRDGRIVRMQDYESRRRGHRRGWPSARAGRAIAVAGVDQQRCFGGQGVSLNEQNTQQSPPGRSRSSQPRQT